MTNFKLTGVGVGPGDPELITIKGLRAIEAAQLIFVPRSTTGEQSLALRIVEPWLKPDQQVVKLSLPMTRNADQLLSAWQAAADVIAAAYTESLTLAGGGLEGVEQSGSTTNRSAFEHFSPLNPPAGGTSQEAPGITGVYLLLGDPLLYGTFIYIWQQLQERHPEIAIEMIPGVTSFAAAAAVSHFPLSTTSDRVAIIPASYETDDAQIRRLFDDYETVIFLKVGPVLPQILETVENLGLMEQALFAERVGMPEEKIVVGADIQTLRGQRRPYLSLLIVRSGIDKS